MANTSDAEPTLIGWREWVSFPDWGIPAVKVKIDTGARTSALHAVDLDLIERDGMQFASFEVHPWQRSARDGVRVVAPLVDQRQVTSSSGETSMRPVVRAVIDLDGAPESIELTLTRRDDMGFKMLLGRTAMEGRHYVDPASSYLHGRPDLRTRRRNRGTR
ncbi:MAG: ATP-dependent zinc protease [Ilumatobacter sp.]